MLPFMLFSLVTLTTAAPQNFNYNHRESRQPHLEYGPAPAPSTKTNLFDDLQRVMDIQTGNYDVPNFISNSIEDYPMAPLNNIQTTFPALEFTKPQNFDSVPAAPIVSKRFFLHEAPPDDDEPVQQKLIFVGKPRKNFNVVFIKAPNKIQQRASLKILPARNEERTVIYVLAKKQDATEIDAQVHEPVTITAKPEVYFIKYKTNVEAEQAQQAIQAQYDALGGSTHVSDEGVAPVSSVIGALAAQQRQSDAPINQTASEAYDFKETGADADLQNSVNTQLPSSFSAIQQSAPFETNANESNGYLPPLLRV